MKLKTKIKVTAAGKPTAFHNGPLPGGDLHCEMSSHDEVLITGGVPGVVEDKVYVNFKIPASEILRLADHIKVAQS